jgi:hypothetical protein
MDISGNLNNILNSGTKDNQTVAHKKHFDLDFNRFNKKNDTENQNEKDETISATRNPNNSANLSNKKNKTIVDWKLLLRII